MRNAFVSVLETWRDRLVHARLWRLSVVEDIAMDVERKLVHLSSQQLLCLKNSDFLPASLSKLIERCQLTNGRTLDLSYDLAEQFREAFTERPVKVGLDEKHEPASEAKMLEDLISL